MEAADVDEIAHRIPHKTKEIIWNRIQFLSDFIVKFEFHKPESKKRNPKDQNSLEAQESIENENSLQEKLTGKKNTEQFFGFNSNDVVESQSTLSLIKSGLFLFLILRLFSVLENIDKEQKYQFKCIVKFLQ